MRTKGCCARSAATKCVSSVLGTVTSTTWHPVSDRQAAPAPPTPDVVSNEDRIYVVVWPEGKLDRVSSLAPQ
jgi:hypothetical protein